MHEEFECQCNRASRSPLARTPNKPSPHASGPWTYSMYRNARSWMTSVWYEFVKLSARAHCGAWRRAGVECQGAK